MQNILEIMLRYLLGLPLLLSSLIRSRFQVKHATLLIPIDPSLILLVEELYGSQCQRGYFSLFNVGSGFHCLRSFCSLLLSTHTRCNMSKCGAWANARTPSAAHAKNHVHIMRTRWKRLQNNTHTCLHVTPQLSRAKHLKVRAGRWLKCMCSELRSSLASWARLFNT